MAHRVSIFVGLVVRAETPTAAAASAAGLVDAFNANPSGFALVNQHAQTAAIVANVAAITVQASPVAFINVATNSFADATVKIIKKYGCIAAADVCISAGVYEQPWRGEASMQMGSCYG